MGQAISRIKPRRSHQPTNASQALHHEISRPEPPRRLTHISELIDIDQLIRQRSSPPTDDTKDTLFTEEEAPTTDDGAAASVMMIQSPSGNILSPQQYLERPDRVMTLEERKNSIRSNTERRIRVHESREALRAEALLRTTAGALHRQKKISDEEDRHNKEDDADAFFVLAQDEEEPVGKNLAEREILNGQKGKPKKGRLSCLSFFWSR